MSEAAAERADEKEGQEGGAAAPSVGAMLRAAREAAGLSLQDVAQALKYAPRQVDRLEADDYTALPGAVFVRGFVRNYARLLKIDAEPLLAELSATLPLSPAEVRPPANMGSADDSSPGGRRSLALLVAAVATVAALILALRFFWPADAPLDPPGSARPAAPPSAQAAESATSLPVAEKSSFPAEKQDAPQPPTAPAATLALSFAGRSWVEIVDGQGKVLHRAENAAGSTLELSGQPPFDLVIGNAKAVTLLYRGEPIDLAPHTRAEVARLKLE